jgi:hypothetical protein
MDTSPDTEDKELEQARKDSRQMELPIDPADRDWYYDGNGVKRYIDSDKPVE